VVVAFVARVLFISAVVVGLCSYIFATVVPGHQFPFTDAPLSGCIHRRQLGGYVARMDRCLMGFSSEACNRTHMWDLRNVLCIRKFLTAVQEPSRRDLAAKVLDK